jgi:Arc/MetJ-type ribon-helix-helix transcriptional regulator
MPGVDLSDVVLPDDLQRALISKVESGQFSSVEALIEKALRWFLIDEPAREASERDRATEPQPRRLPSPFVLDEWAYGPGDIPRSGGGAVSCRFLRDEKRWPDRFPGE